MDVLRVIQSCTRWLGFDLVPYTAAQHALLRRRRLLEHYRIDTVLDVGANTGQFALELRGQGYRGRIVSFEPLSEAFSRLQGAARGDAAWRVLNIAIGDTTGRQKIHMAGNSESSSMLDMLPLHLEAAPYSRFEGEESVQMQTLDSIFDEVCSRSENIFLKVDTQGYEAHVLRGAARSLSRIDTLQIEMSLAPLYAGQALFDELYADLVGRGYVLVGVEPNFGDARTGHLLQFDGVFRRGPVVSP